MVKETINKEVTDKNLRGIKNLSGIVRSYFDMDGMQIQFNVSSTKTLREAQKNPDKYRDLLIRVAGYSAFFTELHPEMQEDIINRTEHELGN